jgi:hypothetical protein
MFVLLVSKDDGPSWADGSAAAKTPKWSKVTQIMVSSVRHIVLHACC